MDSQKPIFGTCDVNHSDSVNTEDQKDYARDYGHDIWKVFQMIGIHLKFLSEFEIRFEKFTIK